MNKTLVGIISSFSAIFTLVSDRRMNSPEIPLVFLCFVTNFVTASEKAVLDTIFQDYDSRIRPVKNSSLPISVVVNPQIVRLIEVVS